MSKLLNDEELAQKLDTLLASANYRAILNLFQSQKIAHADMVIGKDFKKSTRKEDSRFWNYERSSGNSREMVDKVRADSINHEHKEQRKRNK